MVELTHAPNAISAMKELARVMGARSRNQDMTQLYAMLREEGLLLRGVSRRSNCTIEFNRIVPWDDLENANDPESLLRVNVADIDAAIERKVSA